MEELFKKLNPSDSVPEDLKKELISSLDNLTLFADIVDLFTVKAVEAEATLLDLAATENNQELNPKEDDLKNK